MHRPLALLPLLLLLPACTISIGAVRPEPMVDLPAGPGAIALGLGPQVADRFTISNGALAFEIDSFHQTLASGFQSMIRASHPIAPPGNADGSLLIDEIVAEGTQAYRTLGLRLRYRARLVDRQGRELRRSFGTVESRDRVMTRFPGTLGDNSFVLTSAVEAMFERIAMDCFVNPPPRFD